MIDWHTRILLTAVIAIAPCAFVTGCDDQNEATTAAQIASETQAVDPRFATAEALVHFYNTITTTGPTVDVDQLIPLFYAENALQDRLFRIYQSSIPYLRLNQACWDQYGTGFNPTSPAPPFASYPEPARFVEKGPERARAVQRAPYGEEETIYLVRIGDRWWVSGFTLQYFPTFDTSKIDLDRMEKGIGYLSSVAPLVEHEVRSDSHNWKQYGKEAIDLVRLRFVAYLQRDHPEIADEPNVFEWSKDN